MTVAQRPLRNLRTTMESQSSCRFLPHSRHISRSEHCRLGYRCPRTAVTRVCTRQLRASDRVEHRVLVLVMGCGGKFDVAHPCRITSVTGKWLAERLRTNIRLGDLWDRDWVGRRGGPASYAQSSNDGEERELHCDTPPG